MIVEPVRLYPAVRLYIGTSVMIYDCGPVLYDC